MPETHRYNTSWDKIRRVFPEGGPYTVLDLGCGDGSLVEPILDAHAVVGLDTNAEAVREAYARGLHAVKGSIEQPFPFPDDFCDIVLALDILEHVVDMETVFQEIKRVSKSDGALIIAMPNHFDLRTRLDIFCGKGIIKWSQREFEKKSWDYAHLRFLTLRELDAMLRSFGWYPEVWQFNFMSQGLLPTRLIPPFLRRGLVSLHPSLWSGKFVVRARRIETREPRRLILAETPEFF